MLRLWLLRKDMSLGLEGAGIGLLNMRRRRGGQFEEAQRELNAESVDVSKASKDQGLLRRISNLAPIRKLHILVLCYHVSRMEE